jgi:hypothetical protein
MPLESATFFLQNARCKMERIVVINPRFGEIMWGVQFWRKNGRPSGAGSRAIWDKYSHLVEPSGLFDADWYIQKYPEATTSGLHPFDHYILEGWKKGHSPGPMFDATWYLTYYELAGTGYEPLLHFIRHGAAEGRKTNAKDLNVMAVFQSLGDNCEFGLVQRQVGAEPLGLFRFASTRIDGLIAAFESRFARFQSPENIQVRCDEDPNGGYGVFTSVPSYQFNCHSGHPSVKINVDKLIDKERKRLNFLARVHIEEAETGNKLLVYKSNFPVADERIKDLHSAINSIGPSWLLWVTPATADWPAGRVQEVAEHILRGSIERFAPYDNAYQFSPQGWQKICSKAHDLWAARRSTQS